MRTERFVHVHDLPGTSAAVSSAIQRAERAGQIVGIRKGLYWKGRSTRYGMTRPTAEQIAVAVLGKTGVGPRGYTAARALGLTTQVPRQQQFTIAGPVPTSVPGVEVCKRNNMARRKLRFLEIAVLELLRGDWETAVDDGWPALVAAVNRASTEGRLRLRTLAEVTHAERSIAARQNMARLVEDLS